MRLDTRFRCLVALKLLLLLPTAAALGSLTREARAQLPTTSSLACMNEIPASSFTRVPVHLDISYANRDARRLRNDAQLLATRLADRTRRLLGAEQDSIPAGEPRVSWATYAGSLIVTVHKRGAVTWQIDRSADSVIVAHTDSGSLADSAVVAWLARRHAGDLLLDEAMRAEVAAQAPLFAWPRFMRGDSLRFDVALAQAAMPGADAARASREKKPTFPVFSVLAPAMERARQLGSPVPVRYPHDLIARGISGEVTLRFIIDADGRSDPASMHDISQSTTRRPTTGEGAADHAMFVESARRAMLAARFAPTRVGGCAVREIVSKHFEFLMQ